MTSQLPHEHPAGAAATRSQIGPYHVVRELGRGGMGVVYEAVHEHLQRRVAIKLMLPELARNPQYRERFVREARAACNIRHPHVIEVFEFAFADETPYLVMDFLHGETLAQRLRTKQRLALPELLEYALPILSAVSAAHQLGIVHRDLKPGNIMLAQGPDGRVIPKVLDFGTAKWLTQKDLTLTESATFLGTPYYMAPEQARRARNADAQSDQYALGVILYECATGERPFEGATPFEVLHALMTAPVTPPSQLVPGLPKAFDKVVQRALQREPAQRFGSVDELADALTASAATASDGQAESLRSVPGRVRESRPESATLRDLPPPSATWTERRTRRVVAGGLFAASVVAAGWQMLSQPPTASETTHSGASVAPRAAVNVVEQIGPAELAPNEADHSLGAVVQVGAAAPPREPEPVEPNVAAAAGGEEPVQPKARDARRSAPASPAALPLRGARTSGRRSERQGSAAPAITLGDNGAPILE